MCGVMLPANQTSAWRIA